ncbi:LPXTG-motif cell wall anchor domain protein [Corynebacterium efficiens YS-314]|nr:LPXTG-motif cell wall anchor domain protein [Corynebacterium efficiens YS-314]
MYFSEVDGMMGSAFDRFSGSKGVKRTFATLVAAALAVGGLSTTTAGSQELDFQPSLQTESYNPLAPYTDFNVVAFGDLHKVAESEGPVAVGGKLSWAQTQIIAKRSALPVALVVQGGLDWANSAGDLQINPGHRVTGHPLSINLEGSTALDRDNNNAAVQINVVKDGQPYGSTPKIQVNENGHRANQSGYDADRWDTLLRADAAEDISDRLAAASRAECQAPHVLKQVENEQAAAGQEPAYWMEGGRFYVKLKEGVQNIWNLDGETFSNTTEITFRSPAPTAATPLFTNISGTDVTFRSNLAGVSPDANAPGMLWNFPEAEDLTLSGDSIIGSVLAPRAHFDKQQANVDGNIIIRSGELRGSEQHHFPFAGKFTPCGSTPEIGTTVKVKDSDTKVLPLSGGILVDTVSYTGLTPGVRYNLEGELRTVPAGEATGITATHEFTPDAANGTTEVTFEISGDQISRYAGQKLVVFEYLNRGGTRVAQHTDPRDEAQTFTVEQKTEPKTGQFTLKKKLDGIDADAFPVDTSFLVNATWDSEEGEEVTRAVELSPDGTPVTVDNIPVGTTVTFSEPAPLTATGYHFDRVEFDPASLTIEEGGNGEVTATNFYSVIPDPEPGWGKITVSKELAGTGVELVDGEEFTFTLRCAPTDGTILPVEETFTLLAGKSRSFDIPEGMTCVIAEETPAAVDGVTYDGVDYIVDDQPSILNPEIETSADQHVSVKATNTYTRVEVPAMGHFQVRKLVEGVQDQELLEELSFEVEATWDGGSETLTLPATGDFVRSTTELPAGTVVSFTESPEEVVIPGHTFVSVDIAPRSVTVNEDDPVRVTVTNTYTENAVPAISTTAEVTGSPAKVLPVTGGEVVDTVSYTGLRPNTEYVLTGELVHVTSDGVVTPTGVSAQATFTTGNAGEGATEVSGEATVVFDIDGVTAAQYAGEKLVVFEKLFLGDVEIAVHEDPEDEAQSFTVEPSGDVVITKTVTGSNADQINADEQARFQIVASWSDDMGVEHRTTVDVVPGEPVTLSGLPLNTEITLSEEGAYTSVPDVRWADIIWSGEGVVDGTGDSREATVTLTDPGIPLQIVLDNRASVTGLIIIPIPLPLVPGGGSSVPPPVGEPDIPAELTPVAAPLTPTEPGETTPGATRPTGETPVKGALAHTGADILWIAGGAAVLLLAGAWLTIRGRRNKR